MVPLRVETRRLDADLAPAVRPLLHPLLEALLVSREGVVERKLRDEPVSAGLWPNPVGVSWRAALGGASGCQLHAALLFELLLPAERRARKDAALAHIDEARAGVVAAEWQLVARVRPRGRRS